MSFQESEDDGCEDDQRERADQDFRPILGRELPRAGRDRRDHGEDAERTAVAGFLLRRSLARRHGRRCDRREGHAANAMIAIERRQRQRIRHKRRRRYINVQVADFEFRRRLAVPWRILDFLPFRERRAQALVIAVCRVFRTVIAISERRPIVPRQRPRQSPAFDEIDHRLQMVFLILGKRRDHRLRRVVSGKLVVFAEDLTKAPRRRHQRSGFVDRDCLHQPRIGIGRITRTPIRIRDAGLNRRIALGAFQVAIKYMRLKQHFEPPFTVCAAARRFDIEHRMQLILAALDFGSDARQVNIIQLFRWRLESQSAHCNASKNENAGGCRRLQTKTETETV